MKPCEPFSGQRTTRLLDDAANGLALTWVTSSGDGPTDWTELGDLDWSRFRLVLGAGGASGGAFTVGALLALATDHGVNVRNASHLVGTSAGAVLAALMASGLDSEDLAAMVARTPEWLSPVGDAYHPGFGDHAPKMPKLRDLLRPMGPRDLVRSASLAATRRYRALWLHSLRPGTFDIAPQLPFMSMLSWPADRNLSICCTDTADARRVVYDRENSVELADAIAGSCAVPGVMRPIPIGGRVVVDGGVVSPTNADVALCDGESTLTVVVSPMSGTGSRSALGRASSIFAANRLSGELRTRKPQGGVLVIEPAATLGGLVIDDALDGSTSTQILATTFLAASGAEITHRRLAA
ncbi:MAG: patatin-like phospholipase family protein [Ilumatobacteraceae bacterium]